MVLVMPCHSHEPLISTDELASFRPSFDGAGTFDTWTAWLPRLYPHTLVLVICPCSKAMRRTLFAVSKLHSSAHSARALKTRKIFSKQPSLEYLSILSITRQSILHHIKLLQNAHGTSTSFLPNSLPQKYTPPCPASE